MPLLAHGSTTAEITAAASAETIVESVAPDSIAAEVTVETAAETTGADIDGGTAVGLAIATEFKAAGFTAELTATDVT